MSAKKLERLVNLTMLLLSTRRYLTVEQIQQLMPSYDQPDPESFRRMFERDKEELRELGVPLETGSDSVWEDEVGYRIRRTEYELPDIELSPSEAAALGLAARLWHSAGLADASRSALLKLRAAGIEAEPVAGMVEPRVDAPDPAFAPCLAAVRAGQPIRFDHRRPGGTEVVTREIEPWSVVHRHGRWYVVGHDRDRDATRLFRLSRIVGPVTPTGRPGSVVVPEGFDPMAVVAQLEAEPVSATADLLIADDAGWDLRRGAQSEQPADRAGWVRCEVPFSDTERFAEMVVGYGPDVEVCGPPELRTAVVRRLAALVEEPA